MAQANERLTKLTARLWPAGQVKHTYAILDAASIEGLLDKLYDTPGLKFECLFTGDLPPDMAYVAPYLVELPEGSDFARWVLSGWGQHWGVYVLSQAELPELWRHLRTLTRVYDPEGQPMYFRFYDPRVLWNFLPTCSARQLNEMFGPVEKFILEGERPELGKSFSLADGELITENFAF